MDLEEAKMLLNACVRSELRDHAFGDVEVFWEKDGERIASGYFSGGTAVIYFSDATCNGDDARVLRRCGVEGAITRNDETGPENFEVGKIMPGLTKEAIYKELTEDRGELY